MDTSLQSDLEHGPVVGGSFDGSVPGSFDSVDINLHNDEDGVHDQLPSVEEYKTSMAAAAASPQPMTPLELSPPEDDDDGVAHDLPSLDDYIAARDAATEAPKEGEEEDNEWNYFCIFTCVMCMFFGLVATAIVIPVVIISDGEGARLSLIPRKDKVQDYLIRMSISDETKLRTPGTPQYEAALWIADHDEFRMDIPAEDTLDDQFIERYALAVFYHSTGGPEDWRYKANFLQGTHICGWNGETLSPNTGNPIFLGLTDCKEETDSSGTTKSYAREILIYANQMDGTIPDEIGYFRRLESLILFSNPGLTGNIVPGMLGLTSLKDLELQYCAISGTIPANIGNLKALTNLVLSNNLLFGSLPDKLFELSSLQWLFLDDNTFEGDVAQFGKLSNLYGLYAEDAAFHGEITSEMIDGWSNMYELDLSSNTIGGTLPDNILSHPFMVIVDLHENQISGSIPNVLESNPKLKFLSLYDNQLTGSIPTSIGNIEGLVHLDLGLNQLMSPLPSELGLLTSLRYLFTNNNHFDQHPVPEFVFNLTSLRELSMKQNQLTGTIPSELSAIERLVLLDLDRNELEGTIPEEVSLLSSLAFLLLNRNKLTGTLPESMKSMKRLAAVVIDGNSLNGTADAICSNSLIDVQYFSSDCGGETDEVVEFDCECCTLCCKDDVGSCNNFAWTLNLDPIWEFRHTRVRYEVDWTELPVDGATP